MAYLRCYHEGMSTFILSYKTSTGWGVVKLQADSILSALSQAYAMDPDAIWSVCDILG